MTVTGNVLSGLLMLLYELRVDFEELLVSFPIKVVVLEIGDGITVLITDSEETEIASVKDVALGRAGMNIDGPFDRAMDGGLVSTDTEGFDTSGAIVETTTDRFDVALDDSVVEDEGSSSVVMESLRIYTGMLAIGVDTDGERAGVYAADSVVHIVGLNVGLINDDTGEDVELSGALDGRYGGKGLEGGCVVE